MNRGAQQAGAPSVGSVLGELRSAPSALTAARLVLVVVLWGFALAGRPVIVGIGRGLAFATDVLDGYAARRLNRVSAFGSKFDSLVDGIVGPSAVAWLLILRPTVVSQYLVLAGVWFLATYVSLGVGLVRHRRFANLHLQSSRIACVAQYAKGLGRALRGRTRAAVMVGIVFSLALAIALQRHAIESFDWSLSWPTLAAAVCLFSLGPRGARRSGSCSGAWPLPLDSLSRSPSGSARSRRGTSRRAR
jgi:phosphatidylglycerophosphate synthase